MAIQNGSKRITKIYHGSNLTYEDVFGKWQDLPLANSSIGTAQYMEINGLLIVRADINFNAIKGNNYKVTALPSKYKDLKLISHPFVGVNNPNINGTFITSVTLADSSLLLNGPSSSYGGITQFNGVYFAFSYTK